MRHVIAVAIILLTVGAAASAEVRKWTSADGKYTTEAELVAVEQDSVLPREYAQYAHDHGFTAEAENHWGPESC